MFKFNTVSVVVSKSKDCIICNHRIKRHRGKNESCLRTTSSKKIKDIIRILKEQQSVTKIQFCEEVEYLMYHKTCFTQLSKLKQNEIANIEQK